MLERKKNEIQNTLNDGNFDLIPDLFKNFIISFEFDKKEGKDTISSITKQLIEKDQLDIIPDILTSITKSTNFNIPELYSYYCDVFECVMGEIKGDKKKDISSKIVDKIIEKEEIKISKDYLSEIRESNLIPEVFPYLVKDLKEDEIMQFSLDTIGKLIKANNLDSATSVIFQAKRFLEEDNRIKFSLEAIKKLPKKGILDNINDIIHGEKLYYVGKIDYQEADFEEIEKNEKAYKEKKIDLIVGITKYLIELQDIKSIKQIVNNEITEGLNVKKESRDGINKNLILGVSGELIENKFFSDMLYMVDIGIKNIKGDEEKADFISKIFQKLTETENFDEIPKVFNLINKREDSHLLCSIHENTMKNIKDNSDKEKFALIYLDMVGNSKNTDLAKDIFSNIKEKYNFATNILDSSLKEIEENIETYYDEDAANAIIDSSDMLTANEEKVDFFLRGLNILCSHNKLLDAKYLLDYTKQTFLEEEDYTNDKIFTLEASKIAIKTLNDNDLKDFALQIACSIESYSPDNQKKDSYEDCIKFFVENEKNEAANEISKYAKSSGIVLDPNLLNRSQSSSFSSCKFVNRGGIDNSHLPDQKDNTSKKGDLRGKF